MSFGDKDFLEIYSIVKTEIINYKGGIIMKFMRVCLLVCGLMLAFVGVTYASSFSVSADKYGKVEGNGIELVFQKIIKLFKLHS